MGRICGMGRIAEMQRCSSYGEREISRRRVLSLFGEDKCYAGAVHLANGLARGEGIWLPRRGDMAAAARRYGCRSEGIWLPTARGYGCRGEGDGCGSVPTPAAVSESGSIFARGREKED